MNLDLRTFNHSFYSVCSQTNTIQKAVTIRVCKIELNIIIKIVLLVQLVCRRPLDSFRKWSDHIVYLMFCYPALNLVLLHFPFHFKNP